MHKSTTFAIFAVLLLSAGCGDSSPLDDNGIAGDNGSDSLNPRDASHEDVRPDNAGVDVLEPDGMVDADGILEDGRIIEPCRPGGECDDFDPCTINDLCDDGGECAGVPVEDCDDGIECTYDQCTSETECTHGTKPGWCFVEGKCYRDGDGDPAVICRSCQTALKNDALLPDDNLACDDGDSCTVNDRCHEGACVATVMDCYDDNPCTIDSCASGICGHENVEGMCDDDNLCTENDLCVEGTCQGAQIGCWDQNPCTQDACHPDFGCVHEFLDIPCDDGNICSVGDRCWLGDCVPGEDRLDCDDQNDCTDDGCVPIREDGCVHIPNVAPCDDGNPCTLEDKCKAGECTAGAGDLDCDDGNVCTNDYCLAGVGCQHENNAVPCDDGEPCSLDDVCGGGECRPGAIELDCDDGNVCTTDYCETGIGCVYENNVNECDDENICTSGDVCGDGDCLGMPAVGMCDDDDDCTLDFCLPSGDEPGCNHKGLPECRPRIVIDYPTRGATLNRVAGDTITVLGHVEYPKPGMIVWLVNVNGLDVMVDPTDEKWTFTTEISAEHGMNPIVAYGSDVQFGFQDYVVQSFYYSDSWYTVSNSNPTAAMVRDGVMIFLGKTVWDDNNTATADDIATLLTNILGALDLSTLIKNPVTKGSWLIFDYKVNVNHIRYGTLTIDLVPDWGKMRVKIVIPRFSAEVEVPVSPGPDFDGDVSASSIVINADLNLAVDASGNPVASITNPNVVVNDLDVDIGGIWGFLFNWIVDFFEDSFAGMIEDEFEKALSGQLSDLVEGAVADLALEPEFEVPALLPGMQPVTLQMKSKFSTISLTPAGSDIGLSAAVMPDPTQTPPRAIRGALGRGACLGTDSSSPVIPHTSEMGLMAKDDFLNEALYAIWASNALVIPVGPELLGDVDLSTYGVTNLALTVDFLLPPIITGCNIDQKMFFEAGDIRVTASMKLFGQQMTMTMYASLTAEARIVLVAGETGTEVGIQIETPLFIDIEVAEIDGGLVGAEDTISDLIRGVALPMVLDMLSGDTLASFELPSIDLSSLADGIPPGSVIQIDMKTVERAHGATVILGDVK